MMRAKKKGIQRRRATPRIADLSLAEIQELTKDPHLQIANTRLRRAIEAISGWKMAARNGVPKRTFKLASRYEDALGQLREALIAATRDWVLSKACPVCGSRLDPRQGS